MLYILMLIEGSVGLLYLWSADTMRKGAPNGVEGALGERLFLILLASLTVVLGASAVLLFGVVESPVAQPRNFVLGHFLSALVGTCITRLFVLNRQYQGYLDNTHFHPSTFINGGVSMATSLLVMLMTGTAHPPYVEIRFFKCDSWGLLRC